VPDQVRHDVALSETADLAGEEHDAVAVADDDTKSGNVYRSLKEKLEKGHLTAGERITEVGIAKAMGVSRVPVREAILRLEAEGLIKGNGAYGGKYVTYIEDLDPEQVLQQYELREVVEGLAAFLAAKNLNGWQIDELRRINREYKRALRDGDHQARQKASMEFHEYLVGNCGNELVAQTYRINHLMPLGQRSQEIEDMIKSRFTEEERRQDQEKNWEGIIDAIAAHDPEQAERAARAQVRRITEAIRKTIWSKLRA